MPTKRQELVVEITAQADQAQRELAQLTKSAKPLEDGVEVKVKATGADQAAAQLDKAATAGKQLGVVIGGVDAGHVRDIGGPAKIAAAALDDAAQAADRARKALDDIGPVHGPDLPNIKPKVDEISDAAKGAQNAMANLAGNAAQDMSAMLGPLGSVGVAIGQITEYTADARLGGESMTQALTGAASMAAPIAGLSAALLVVNGLIDQWKKKQAEMKAAQEAGTAAFVAATGGVEAWGKALDDAVSAGTASDLQVLNQVMKDALGKETTDAMIRSLSGLGKTMDDLGPSMLAVDEDFRSYAQGALEAQGVSAKTADTMIDLIKSSGSAKTAIGKMSEAGIDVKKMGLTDVVTSLAELNAEARKQDFEKYADAALKAASANSATADAVAKARAETSNATDAWKVYEQGQQTAAKAAEDNARAQEEGAKATADAGSILDQVGRQVDKAAGMAADAMTKAKKAQDDWLVQNVDYQGTVDDFTGSMENLTEGIKKQRDANDENAGSFEGNTKTARDNRDALGEVYQNAVDMNGAMKDAGFSVDGAKAAMDNAAQSAYDMAIQMGLPQTEAEKIRDKIKDIPTLVNTDVVYSEKGYEDRLAEQERLERDIHNTVYFAGVVDRSLQNAINMINWNAPPGTVVSASSAPAAAPSSRMLAAPAGSTLVAPVPVAAAPAPLRTSQTVQVNVNLSGGIVADTFQLQRVVERAARSGARLAGRRP